MKGWYRWVVIRLRASVMRASRLGECGMPEIGIKVGRVESVRRGSGPGDVGESLFGSFQQPAHIGSPDSSGFVLSSADRVIVLRAARRWCYGIARWSGTLTFGVGAVAGGKRGRPADTRIGRSGRLSITLARSWTHPTTGEWRSRHGDRARRTLRYEDSPSMLLVRWDRCACE